MEPKSVKKHSGGKKPWSGIPLSYVYHLVNYGLTNTEVVRALAPIITNRTPDSIHGVAVDVRKYISVLHGHKVERPITESVTKHIKEAAKIQPKPILLQFRPAVLPSTIKSTATNRGHSHTPINLTQQPQDNDEFSESLTASRQVNPPEESPVIVPERVREAIEKVKAEEKYEERTREEEQPQVKQISILSDLEQMKELIRFSKEVGAVEVEYKGAKIKF